MTHGPSPRVRNLAGMFALIVGLAGYAFLVMRLALAIGDMSTVMEILFYGATGLAWIWPAKWLLTWTQKNPERDGGRPERKGRER